MYSLSLYLISSTNEKTINAVWNAIIKFLLLRITYCGKQYGNRFVILRSICRRLEAIFGLYYSSVKWSGSYLFEDLREFYVTENKIRFLAYQARMPLGIKLISTNFLDIWIFLQILALLILSIFITGKITSVTRIGSIHNCQNIEQGLSRVEVILQRILLHFGRMADLVARDLLVIKYIFF